MNFDALWERIDGATLAGDWTQGSALNPGPALEPAPALPIIDLADDFDIEQVLGRGGNGVVMAARQRSLNRVVAIKVLSEAAEARAALALLAEARSAGQLEHPNIVPIHALGQDRDGRPVMIMKRLEGLSWAALLRAPDHPIWDALPHDPIDRQLSIAMQVIAAVMHAHQAGVVHRDIKPGNVMIGAGGEVCLVDWGLAQPIGEAARGPAGTPGFMPPEMLETLATVDPRTDVYLLGATLYAALTGDVPHRGPDLATVVRRTIEGGVDLPAEIPEELSGILRRALAADPAARFATVAALRAALLDFDAHREADRLCSQAEAQLEAITAANTERATAFGAACFGYEAALERWPESPRAREGLRRARLRMVEALLEAGQLDGASRLLERIDPPPTDLATRLAEALAERTARAARVAHLEDAVDTVTGYRGRRLMFPILAVLAVIGPLVMGGLRLGGHLDDGGYPFRRAVGPLVFGLAIALVLRFSARDGLRQAFNRRALGVLSVLAFSTGLSFVSGGLLAMSVPEINARNLLLSAFSAALAWLLLSRDFFWVALTSAGALFAASAWPRYAELLAGITNAIALTALWVVWRRRVERSKASPPTS